MPYMGPDSFKTYPLRFGGYGFGIAEALSGSVTYPVVNGLRIMATGFIFAHTIYRPVQVGKRTNSSIKMATSAADTFLYEAVVSGIVPPVVASGIKRFASQMSSPPAVRAWLPAALALASLPIVVPTCDAVTDIVMDATIRQLYP